MPEPRTRATSGCSRQAARRSSKLASGSITRPPSRSALGLGLAKVESLLGTGGPDEQLRAKLLPQAAGVEDQVVTVNLPGLAMQKVCEKVIPASVAQSNPMTGFLGGQAQVLGHVGDALFQGSYQASVQGAGRRQQEASPSANQDDVALHAQAQGQPGHVQCIGFALQQPGLHQPLHLLLDPA